jgi:glycosyltransferase involved in cell wall biosynthesis
MPEPRISAIIPTRDRPNALRRTLGSLARQTLPPDTFEVIVVDDGSAGSLEAVVAEQFLFELRYLRREGGGATLARNAGAACSRGGLLVFLDDDITLLAETLAALADECARRERGVVIGTLITPEEIKLSMFARLNADEPAQAEAALGGSWPVHFTRCKTGLLAIRREDFFALGQFQDPTGGWPNWDDVEFGYRAHQAGFQFWQSAQAVGEHRDHSLVDLKASCLRWQHASRSAVRLFQRFPGLRPHIPMLHDKTPIGWGRDTLGLIARKLVRQAASSRPMLGLLERFGRLLERRYPSPALLRPLYRWIVGGYMFWGVRMGLEDYGR